MTYNVFLDPPHFVVRPNAVYQMQISQTVSMPCVADGDPTPTVTWHRVYAYANVTRIICIPYSISKIKRVTFIFIVLISTIVEIQAMLCYSTPSSFTVAREWPILSYALDQLIN